MIHRSAPGSEVPLLAKGGKIQRTTTIMAYPVTVQPTVQKGTQFRFQISGG